MKKVLLAAIAFLFGVLFGFYGPAAYQSTRNGPILKSTTGENVYQLNHDVSVYLVGWDEDSGLETIKKNKAKISHLGAFWYELNLAGELSELDGAADGEVINFAKENNIKLLPVISNNNDPARVEKILTDQSEMQAHVSEISNLVENNQYDGIEIDYESLKGKNYRPQFSNFISQLSDQLHSKGKLLAVAVHAKSTDEGTWEGPATQDWKVIGEKADQIKIMAYDYHWSTSEAGDIAPISWIKEVLTYGTKTINPKKIYLGLHFYAYDWVEKQASDLTYDQVADLIKIYAPTINKSAEGEKFFDYVKNDEKHTVYFADQETVKDRSELVNQYGLKGLSVWRAGKEDPGNWVAIGEILK